MTDNRRWAWNFQTHLAFVTDRTAHLVTDADGRTVQTECSLELQVGLEHQHTTDESVPNERHQCGNCPWDSVG